MTIKIDKNIPLPTSGRNAKYPFADMKPGDSFLSTDPAKEAATRRAASVWADRNNAKMTCRKVDGGLRVWRVA